MIHIIRLLVALLALPELVELLFFFKILVIDCFVAVGMCAYLRRGDEGDEREVHRQPAVQAQEIGLGQQKRQQEHEK